jgi:heme A synthase
MHLSCASTTTERRAAWALQFVGALGALFAFAILAASALLRLTSVVDASGVHSTLTPAVEHAVRMVHRISASGVGLLTVIAVGLGWVLRNAVPRLAGPVLGLVAATVGLALIGPWTPGYRYSAVTIANVLGGTVLLGAYWWLRVTLAASAPLERARLQPLQRSMLAMLVVQVSLGAATSALAMRGSHGMAYLHAGVAIVTSMLMGSVLWQRRGDARMERVVVVMAGALGLQLVLGLVSLGFDGGLVALRFVHAMLSALLVGGMVSLLMGDGDSSKQAQED